MAKPTIFGVNALTGGADGALDSVDGDRLTDGDIAVAIDLTDYAPYRLEDHSGPEDEDSPLVITPDANADDKRWILKKGVFAGLTLYGNIVMPDGGMMGCAGAPVLTFDDTLNCLTVTGGQLHPMGGADADVFRLGILESDQYYKIGRAGATGSLVFSGQQEGHSGYDFRIFPTGGVKDTSALRIKEETGKVGINENSPTGRLTVTLVDDTDPSNIGAWDDRHAAFGTAAGGWGISYSATNSTVYMTALAPGVAWKKFRFQAGEHRFYTFPRDDDVMIIDGWGGIFLPYLKSGTDQANAGAAEHELYIDTNDDNTIKIGVGV